jgi:hypothetical protein
VVKHSLQLEKCTSIKLGIVQSFLKKLTVAKLVKESFDPYRSRIFFDVLSMDHALTNSRDTLLLQKLLATQVINKSPSIYGNKTLHKRLPLEAVWQGATFSI